MGRVSARIFRVFIALLVVAGIAVSLLHHVRSAGELTHEEQGCSVCAAYHTLTSFDGAASPVALAVAILIGVVLASPDKEVFRTLTFYVIRSSLDPPRVSARF